MPDATVLTTVFNGAPFVERYCAVVAASADQNLAWLLIDDGSADGTAAAVSELLHAQGLDGRVCILQPGRLGRPAALNLGMATAETDIVFQHDFDDESFPTRFAIQGAMLRADPDLACVGGAYVHVFADLGREEIRGRSFDPAAYLRRFPLYVPFPHTFMAFRRADVLAVGGYPAWDDYEEMGLIARLLGAGRSIGASRELLGRHYIYRASYFERQRPYIARRFRNLRRQLAMKREFPFIRVGRAAMLARFAYAFLPSGLQGLVRRGIGHAD
jgi:glycosyltransferase involved in cell wall biosynthesis